MLQICYLKFHAINDDFQATPLLENRQKAQYSCFIA